MRSRWFDVVLLAVVLLLAFKGWLPGANFFVGKRPVAPVERSAEQRQAPKQMSAIQQLIKQHIAANKIAVRPGVAGGLWRG